MTGAAASQAPQSSGLRHVFYPYQGQGQYLPGILGYVEMARDQQANVLVCAPETRVNLLRDTLPDDGTVVFLDLAQLGRNPGVLIGAWQDWIVHCARDGRSVCGLNEAQWVGHNGALPSEVRYGEWLLNLAFARAPAWSLLCPYDTDGRSRQEVVAMARCHPLQWDGGGYVTAPDYTEGPYEFESLAEPPREAESLPYSITELPLLRHTVTRWATRVGLSEDRTRDAVVAVSEVASNSIRHGGGKGLLRLWTTEESLICELSDAGFISDPLAGRVRPSGEQLGGRGLWFVNQLCDLVQIRSTPQEGTRMRLYIDLPDT